LMKNPFVLFLIVASTVFAGCVGETETTTTQTIAETASTQIAVTTTTRTTIGETQATVVPTTASNAGGVTNLAGIRALVIDKDTKRPVEDVLVFIGTGYKECQTDESGRCTIEDFAWGSYSLNTFRKGYSPFTNSTYFEKGENRVTIELDKQMESQESFTVEGTVIETVVAGGSRSENRYLKVKNEGGEYYLFNRYGLNQGFDDYVGKMVRIVGYNGTGSIGWESQKTRGIYVEEIKPLGNNQKEPPYHLL